MGASGKPNPNRKFKQPPKVKQTVLEYSLVALIMAPFMITTGVFCYIYHVSTPLTCLFYGIIFLIGYFSWMLIKSKIKKRQNEIRKKRKAQRDIHKTYQDK